MNKFKDIVPGTMNHKQIKQNKDNAEIHNYIQLLTMKRLKEKATVMRGNEETHVQIQQNKENKEIHKYTQLNKDSEKIHKYIQLNKESVETQRYIQLTTDNDEIRK